MSSLSERLFKSIFSRKSKNKVVPISDEFTDLSEKSEDKEQEEKEQEQEPEEQFLDAELIEVIPQIDGTCWFNSILMALLYSQGIRRVIIQEVAKWTPEEIRDDKFKGFVVYILKYNYKNPEKIRELFKRRFKTSSLLLSLLKKSILLEEDIKIFFKNTLKKNILNIGHLHHKFLLQTSFLDILFKNKDNYLSVYYDSSFNLFYKGEIDREIKPKIIFLYHFRHLNEEATEIIVAEHTNTLTYEYNIINYEEVIIINGIIYRLDACINGNYNKEVINSGHAITGITYDYKPYVYNGWTLARNPDTKIRPYKKIEKYACPLFPYDWKENLIKITEGFCISREKCDLKEEDKRDVCFNFNKKGGAILVYVRVDEQETSLASLQPGIRATDLQFNSRSLSSIEREFYKIDEKNLDELREQLIRINYINREELDQYELELRANKYNIFYFMIFHKRLEDELKIGVSIEEILTAIYRELLKVYIKTNSKIYKLPILTDDLIFNHLSIERIKKILGIIGYNETEIDNIYEDPNNYLILWYLLNTENETDENHLLFLIMRLYILFNKKLKLEELSDKRILESVKLNSLIKRQDRIYKRIINEKKETNSLLQDIFDKYEIGIYKYHLLAFIISFQESRKIYEQTKKLNIINLENLFS